MSASTQPPVNICSDEIVVKFFKLRDRPLEPDSCIISFNGERYKYIYIGYVKNNIYTTASFKDYPNLTNVNITTINFNSCGTFHFLCFFAPIPMPQNMPEIVKQKLFIKELSDIIEM